MEAALTRSVEVEGRREEGNMRRGEGWATLRRAGASEELAGACTCTCTCTCVQQVHAMQHEARTEAAEELAQVRVLDVLGQVGDAHCAAVVPLLQ